MTHYGTWSPYTGGNSIILAVVLFLVVGILLFLAIRLHHQIEVKRPGKLLLASLVGMWLLSVTTFLMAAGIYALADEQQKISFTGPLNPIFPVTAASGVVTFFVIMFLTQRSGFWIAVGSAIVGAIAAPMIFEFPFDLIVMWRTYPPAPGIAFTLLYFLSLFLIEMTSFMLLTFSPHMKLSRSTLFLLAGMFLVFAVWALFGFAYPATPIPVALNVISKVLAFATAISLFLPAGKSVQFVSQPVSVGLEGQ